MEHAAQRAPGVSAGLKRRQVLALRRSRIRRSTNFGVKIVEACQFVGREVGCSVEYFTEPVQDETFLEITFNGELLDWLPIEMAVRALFNTPILMFYYGTEHEKAANPLRYGLESRLVWRREPDRFRHKFKIPLSQRL